MIDSATSRAASAAAECHVSPMDVQAEYLAQRKPWRKNT